MDAGTSARVGVRAPQAVAGGRVEHGAGERGRHLRGGRRARPPRWPALGAERPRRRAPEAELDRRARAGGAWSSRGAVSCRACPRRPGTETRPAPAATHDDQGGRTDQQTACGASARPRAPVRRSARSDRCVAERVRSGRVRAGAGHRALRRLAAGIGWRRWGGESGRRGADRLGRLDVRPRSAADAAGGRAARHDDGRVGAGQRNGAGPLRRGPARARCGTVDRRGQGTGPSTSGSAPGRAHSIRSARRASHASLLVGARPPGGLGRARILRRSPGRTHACATVGEAVPVHQWGPRLGRIHTRFPSTS